MIVCPKDAQENEVLRRWLEQRLPTVNLGNDCWCLAVWRDDQIVAVAGFNNYRHTDIELSFAADNPRWATRQTVTWILAFPFVQLKTQRCTAMVLKSNKRVRRLLNGLGFREEGKHRHAGPELETMFSYAITREDYEKRYLVRLNGKERSTDTAAAA